MTTARKSAAASSPGSDAEQAGDAAIPADTGVAKSATRALLVARRQRIGRDAGQIEVLVGKRHATG